MYFYNYKNNKRTNRKFNKVFATRRHFNVKFGTVFFSDKLGNIRQDRTIFFSTKSVSDKKFEIFTSQTEAHPGFGKGGGTTEGVGAKQVKGVGFHIKKTLILAHFFNEKGHAVSAVIRDNTKMFSQLTVGLFLKAEAWPK